MKQNDQVGRVVITDNRATITFTRSLRHPPNTVWDALTNPQEFSTWYNGKLEIDGRVGGLLEVFPGDFHWSGPILIWEPPKVLEYEHNHAPCKVMPTGETTIIRWELEATGEGTILTFTQSRLKRTFGFAPIMHVFLERLEAYLDGQPIIDHGSRFHEVKSFYPVWRARTSEYEEVLP